MKKLTLYIFCLLSTFTAFSQAITFNKAIKFPAIANLGGTATKPIDGGYLVVGTGREAYYSDNNCLRIIKVDSSGNELWRKVYGNYTYSYYSGYGGALVNTHDGNFVVAGAVQDTGTYDVHFLLFKFTPEGDSLWSKVYHSVNWKEGLECVQDADSNFYIAGYRRHNTTQQTDIIVAKMDRWGEMIWEKSYGGNYFDVAISIDHSHSGNLILGGTNSSLNPVEGYAQGYIFEIDTAGNMLWEKTYGTVFETFGLTPRRTSDGGYICRGGKDSTIVVGHYEDVSYVTKKDAQGNTLWRTFFTSTEAHTFWMAQEVKDGNYVAVGSALDEETEGYEDDGWIVKLDQQGGVMWERRYQFHSGAPIVNRLRGFHPTDDGGIIATGTTVTEKEPGPGWYTTFWLLKLDSVGCLSPGCDSLDTPVFHMPVEENTFTVYPNPAVDKVFAQAQLPSHVSGAEMKIFSLKGEELAHRTVVGNQIVHFRVGDYPAGMYIVTLEIEQRVVARKKLMVVR